MSTILDVAIRIDGKRREFVARGDAATVVAAFRAWLDSPDCARPQAEGADAIDMEAETLMRNTPPHLDRECQRATHSRLAAESLPDRLMRTVFFAGSDEYPWSRIATVLRGTGYTLLDLKAALTELVHEGKVRVRTIGAERRWRRAEEQPCD